MLGTLLAVTFVCASGWHLCVGLHVRKLGAYMLLHYGSVLGTEHVPRLVRQRFGASPAWCASQ
jgi:hypothetical protein